MCFIYREIRVWCKWSVELLIVKLGRGLEPVFVGLLVLFGLQVLNGYLVGW